MSSSRADSRGALRLAPHASRIVLVLAAILLARIGSPYILDPVGALKPDGIVVQSAHTPTVARVGLGASLSQSRSSHWARFLFLAL